MNHSPGPSVTRINELQQQIALLANLRPAAGAVVSCYLDLGQDKSMLQTFVRNRLGAELARVPAAQRGAFEACIDVIEAQLESEMPLRTRGLAVFAAADGKAPLLSAMPFAVPFRRSLTVSRIAGPAAPGAAQGTVRPVPDRDGGTRRPAAGGSQSR